MQYKSIAQVNEAALKQIEAAHEEYKTEVYIPKLVIYWQFYSWGVSQRGSAYFARLRNWSAHRKQKYPHYVIKYTNLTMSLFCCQEKRLLPCMTRMRLLSLQIQKLQDSNMNLPRKCGFAIVVLCLCTFPFFWRSFSQILKRRIRLEEML